jgi:hypothetical protein
MMVAGACATGTAPEATVSSARAQPVQSSVSEINRALATLARNTSALSGDYRIGPEDLLQITLYNVTADTGLTPSSDVRLTPRTTIDLEGSPDHVARDLFQRTESRNCSTGTIC